MTKESSEIKNISKKTLNSNKSRENILAAACHLFAENGFDGTTSKEIAKLATCSEGLIFKYFKDKKNLFNILMFDWVDSCILELQELPETKNLEDELTLLAQWFFNTYSNKRDLYKMFIGQRFNGNVHDDLSICREEYLQHRNNLISDRLKKYQKTGELTKNIDLTQLLEMFQGYALIETLFRDISIKTEKTKIKSLIKLVLVGIKNSSE